jgi:5'-nucleotidase
MRPKSARPPTVTLTAALLAVLLASTGCRTPAPAGATSVAELPATPPIHLTLVGTNDLHGWVLPQREAFPGGELRYGGVAAFSGYLRRLRQENPQGVVLLDAGDLFQGTLVSNLGEGAVVVEAYNAMGYDAASIGNHEFDYGPIGPASAAVRPGQDPFGALKARIAQAHFPFLSVNIYEKETGLRPGWLPGDGTILIERRGVKVGIFGLTTPQTPTVTLPVNVASLRFGSLAPEAAAAARKLRERGAEVVVAVVHAGGRCHDCSNPHDTSSCDLDTGEVFEMLRGVPEGAVDAVISGHTHAQIGHFVNGAAVVQSLALGRAFGTVDLYLDPRTHRVLRDRTRIDSAIPVCETMDEASRGCDPKRLKASAAPVKVVPAEFHGQPLEPDAALAGILGPAEAQVAELQNRPLGLEVPEALVRNYEDESPLGSLLADTLRAMTHADVALVNPGGLRADLRKGPLTYGEVYEVMPFENQVATLVLSAEQLKRVLAAAYGSRKGVFQVSGVEVKLGRCPTPDRLKSFSLAGGKSVDPVGRYKVVMSDFLARGGDGLGPALTGLAPGQVDMGDARGLNYRDELVAFWQEKKPPLVSPRRGRVAFLEAAGPCGPGTKVEAPTRAP